MKLSHLVYLFTLLAAVLTFKPTYAAVDGQLEIDPVLPTPNAEYAPEDVVRIVIEALSHNDEPFANAGIETTFGFASPANKVNTGPLDRFVSMVKDKPYGIMVDHVDSEFSEVRYMNGSAVQLVYLLGRDGRGVVFAFRLSQQGEGPFKGMWMTDAVWPVATADTPFQGF
ncbi:MAG: DUF4864 domain-containing protein [Gammaproteobacteria bacterium]|nr:DUF4864 domain-containing protein [Gammaproteobacteria bacterium]